MKFLSTCFQDFSLSIHRAFLMLLSHNEAVVIRSLWAHGIYLRDLARSNIDTLHTKVWKMVAEKRIKIETFLRVKKNAFVDDCLRA